VFGLDGGRGAFCMSEVGGFESPLAAVACRQFGYADGVLIPKESSHSYVEIHARTYIQNVRCAGNESNIRECSISFRSSVKQYELVMEPCADSACYRRRGFSRVYGRKGEDPCNGRDLIVQCHRSGYYDCYDRYSR